MLTITKEVEFHAAHLLDGHEGDCKNLHGHTYKLLAELVVKDNVKWSVQPADVLDPNYAMVADFSSVKHVLNKVVVSKVDHAFVCVSPPDQEGLEPRRHSTEIAELCKELGLKVCYLPNDGGHSQTTCERMVLHFAEWIQEELDAEDTFLNLHSLTLYETATSFAKWTRER